MKYRISSHSMHSTYFNYECCRTFKKRRESRCRRCTTVCGVHQIHLPVASGGVARCVPRNRSLRCSLKEGDESRSNNGSCRNSFLANFIRLDSIVLCKFVNYVLLYWIHEFPYIKHLCFSSSLSPPPSREDKITPVIPLRERVIYTCHRRRRCGGAPWCARHRRRSPRLLPRERVGRRKVLQGVLLMGQNGTL